MSSIENQPSSRNEDEDFLFASQLVTGSMLSMVMKVAVELDMFGIIAKAGPGAQLSPKYIASQLTSQNPNAPAMLDRILRFLASYSIITSSLVTHDNGLVERLYGLASVCKYFVQNVDGVSLSPMVLLIQDQVFMDSWYHMKDVVLEGGIPFNKAHGMHIFEYTGVDRRFNQVFNKGMLNHTTIVMKKILETYTGFEDLKELIDVGGGVGTTISIVTSKYPTIRGINFDLPQVIEHAPSYPGVEHVGGNMFESVPNCEAIFMKTILHDWSDEYCLNLLKNCYKALPIDGKIVVVEAIVPVAAETDTTAKVICQIDLIMLTQNLGGKERTQQEFDTLANNAGFSSMKKVCCVSNYWVMEFYKK